MLARSIRQAVGFRNVLVHDYIRVNDEIVVGRYHLSFVSVHGDSEQKAGAAPAAHAIG